MGCGYAGDRLIAVGQCGTAPHPRAVSHLPCARRQVIEEGKLVVRNIDAITLALARKDVQLLIRAANTASFSIVTLSESLRQVGSAYDTWAGGQMHRGGRRARAVLKGTVWVQCVLPVLLPGAALP